VIAHPENQGVGGSMKTGYQAALEKGADIVVKMDGDELLNFVNLVHDSGPDLSEVYVLTEGLDPDRGFEKALEKEIGVAVKVPSYGESFGV